jgi:hypothetical protein
MLEGCFLVYMSVSSFGSFSKVWQPFLIPGLNPELNPDHFSDVERDHADYIEVKRLEELCGILEVCHDDFSITTDVTPSFDDKGEAIEIRVVIKKKNP